MLNFLLALQQPSKCDYTTPAKSHKDTHFLRHNCATITVEEHGNFSHQLSFKCCTNVLNCKRWSKPSQLELGTLWDELPFPTFWQTFVKMAQLTWPCWRKLLRQLHTNYFPNSIDAILMVCFTIVQQTRKLLFTTITNPRFPAITPWGI